MATEQQENGSTEVTSGQEQQGQQQAPAAGTAAEEQQQQASTPVIDKNTQLPDDHPLVVNHSEVKEKLARLTTELQEARTNSAKATQLEEELGKRPTTEAMETLQTRYDRLEAFVMAVGMGQALDSRTFTKDLFETDKDIAQLVKDWNKAHPSATSTALSSTAGGQQAEDKKSPNELLRIAAGKA